jgi:leader peptidase (prepilin peptidase)/N-methyltransferase
MNNLSLIQWSAAVTGLLFWCAFGGICGSFINVLVYRLPLGLNVVTPPSACPACGTKLAWYDNIPVLGWIMLRGRCRYCRTPISAEYPIVEFITALIFGGMWAVWFMHPSLVDLIGIRQFIWRPDFAVEGIWRMWPMFLVMLALTGSLIAATLIDARTFTIPLIVPWFATAVGLIVHPLHAAWIQNSGGMALAAHSWTIPFRPGGGVGLAIGGALGVVLSIVMLRWRVIPQSFEDYPEWEAKALETQAGASACPDSGGGQAVRPGNSPSFKTVMTRTILLTGPAIALMFAGFTFGLPRGQALGWMTTGAGVGLICGLILRRMAPDQPAADGQSEEPIWSHYPHTRREIWKEVLFCLPCCLLAAVGWWLTRPAGLLGTATADAPLWLHALSGALLGYLVGGGIVWVFRIGGSLALGKEAMGLGDVHLMAAVGACLGWIDPLLAFFTAPFLGIGWAVLSVLFRQVFHRKGTALPYGPHLATATMMVILLKPAFEQALSTILTRSVNIP